MLHRGRGLAPLFSYAHAAPHTVPHLPILQEMAAYRLYTVVPYLVKFIDNLTNVYVRYNRKRMKGAGGSDDALMALAALFDVLLSVCKVRRGVGGGGSWGGGEWEERATHSWHSRRSLTCC